MTTKPSGYVVQMTLMRKSTTSSSKQSPRFVFSSVMACMRACLVLLQLLLLLPLLLPLMLLLVAWLHFANPSYT